MKPWCFWPEIARFFFSLKTPCVKNAKKQTAARGQPVPVNTLARQKVRLLEFELPTIFFQKSLFAAAGLAAAPTCHAGEFGLAGFLRRRRDPGPGGVGNEAVRKLDHPDLVRGILL